MTALRERLAQMGEVARAATPGPWATSFTCHGAREERITHHVCTDGDLVSLEDAERDTPDDAHGAAVVTHIATFSPDVAAALVAVADAAADHIDCPLCGLAGGEHDADDECPLARLAAALGVSR